jgi:6-phosphogluconolactonase
MDISPALEQLKPENKGGINLLYTENQKLGSGIARGLLYRICDIQTVLFLSGGRSPAGLYTDLAREKKLTIGSAALVDERYGQPGHADSNELAIRRTGLLEYFKTAQIPFYPILTHEPNIENATRVYDQVVKLLLSRFPKSAAVLGMGEDGHIAGIAPHRVDFIDPLLTDRDHGVLVSCFVDPKPMSAGGESRPPYGFGPRVTMTIRGLQKLDALIVLAFGEKKKAALSALFAGGPIDKIPARLVKDKSLAGKTVLITDQKV